MKCKITFSKKDYLNASQSEIYTTPCNDQFSPQHLDFNWSDQGDWVRPLTLNPKAGPTKLYWVRPLTLDPKAGLTKLYWVRPATRILICGQTSHNGSDQVPMLKDHWSNLAGPGRGLVRP